MSKRFNAGSYELEINPKDWQIPKRTGTSVLERFDGDTAVILFSMFSQGYKDDGVEVSVVYAIDENMVCGIITQLLRSMSDAGVPEQLLTGLLQEALATLDTARRTN